MAARRWRGMTYHESASHILSEVGQAWADLGITPPNLDDKATLATMVVAATSAWDMTQGQKAAILGCSASDMSSLKHGRVSVCSAARLLEMLSIADRRNQNGGHSRFDTQAGSAPGRSSNTAAPIAQPTKAVRRRKARQLTVPINNSPSVASNHIGGRESLDTLRESATGRVVDDAAPIGNLEKGSRRRKTETRTTPLNGLSSVAPITEIRGSDAAGDDGHGTRDTQFRIAIVSPIRKRKQAGDGGPIEDDSQYRIAAVSINHASDGADGDGQVVVDNQKRDAVAVTVSRLVELQKIRRFCITSQSRCDRSMEALIASTLGYSTDIEEKDRKKLFLQASKIRKSVEEGGEGQIVFDTHTTNALSAITSLVPLSAASRGLWDKRRADTEAEMEKLAKTLPVWPFVEGIRGLGAKGLAVIVGLAGIPIGDYRSVSGLWKRMGLAVINGESQRRKKDKVLAEMHGYSPYRRSELWAFCSDTMFRAQWRGDKDEDGKNPTLTGKPIAVAAHPIGEYGEIYARRREATKARMLATEHLPKSDPDRWSAGRCHNDGRRIMTKELLKDLWVEWRRVTRFEQEAI